MRLRPGQKITVDDLESRAKKIRRLLNEITNYNVAGFTTRQIKPAVYPDGAKNTRGILSTKSRQQEEYKSSYRGIDRLLREVEYLDKLR